MKIIYFIFIYVSCLSSQDHIDALIQDVLHGFRDSVATSMPMIEQEYPNNSSVMYLKGLLETDGEKAMTIFSKLYNTHPTSDYGDDAVMKVAEYYYVAGLYIQAGDWLKKMPIYYSRSEHIERAVKLFLNSLIVSGLKDTAIFYSRVFEKQFPNLDVDGKVNNLLRDFEESNQAKKGTLEQISTDPNDNDTNGSFGMYSLQSGAFSVRENAELQKTNLIISGFSARIAELYKDNNILYVVRIGYFETKDDALEVRSQIKTKLNLKTIVVTNS